MPTVRLIRSIVLSIVFIGGLAASASANNSRLYFTFPGEPRLPECSSALVRGAVARTVSRAKRSYNDGRRILGLNEITEADFDVNRISPLARRFCQGQATLSDGRTMPVYYMIEKNAGLLGFLWNVEACLEPLDKWRVYGASCSTVRPR